MGEALRESDWLGRGMAWPQSLLGKEGRQCWFLISILLEPGNVDSSGDFARDSPLDLVLFMCWSSLVCHTRYLETRCGGTL